MNSLLSNVNFSQGESKEIGNFEEITGISPSRVVSLFTFNVTTNIATIHGATIYNDMLYFGVAKECTVYSGFLRVAYK